MCVFQQPSTTAATHTSSSSTTTATAATHELATDEPQEQEPLLDFALLLTRHGLPGPEHSSESQGEHGAGGLQKHGTDGLSAERTASAERKASDPVRIVSDIHSCARARTHTHKHTHTHTGV